MDIRPYAIAISDAELADLQSRLERTRWPAALGDDWERGTPVPYAQRLAEYWRTRYDWRAEEAKLNRLPQFVAEIDGQPIHGLHVRSEEKAAVPLLLIHGSRRWGDVTFREELADLQLRLPTLRVVHVLSQPHRG